jgi:hypothetical protein
LLHAFQFGLEVFFVDGLADRRVGYSICDLFAEGVLFAEFVPRYRC